MNIIFFFWRMQNVNVNLRPTVSLTLFGPCLSHSLLILDDSFLVYLAKTYLKIVTIPIRKKTVEKYLMTWFNSFSKIYVFKKHSHKKLNDVFYEYLFASFFFVFFTVCFCSWTNVKNYSSVVVNPRESGFQMIAQWLKKSLFLKLLKCFS